MSLKNVFIPENYAPKLNVINTQMAIKLIKDTFERQLAKELELIRVSAPLFVTPASGLNDNLNGVERPVQFDILDMGCDVQIVQSLAKWKRLALHHYGFREGQGIYTDMNAIRRDEVLDNTHSVYVDQWDWELIIGKNSRNMHFLEDIVKKIVKALYRTQELLRASYPQCKPLITKEVTFITTQELEDRYPGLTSKERECEISKENGVVFLTQIGKTLKSGNKHDNRAPDYDDWELNGDLLVWNPVLNDTMEISSMGIRVDSEALDRQLKLAGCDERRELKFHKMLLEDTLPLTIGGGLGQSRICMLLLQKAHIGEVQASVWPEDMIETCKQHGIMLL